MLDVKLDLISQLLVVIVATFELEINQEAEVLVESEKLFLGLLVGLKLFLEVLGVSSSADLIRSAVVAVAVLWVKLVEANSLLLISDISSVVNSTAVIARILALFDLYLDIVWQAQVHESVHSASVLLEHLGFGSYSREIGEDKAVS